VIVYLAVVLFSITVNYIYSLFGHGESSGFMTWMFLYPLIGGILLFIISGLLPKLTNKEGYRIFYNLYNAGIATLTVGSFMKGIFDIAGTSSRYVLAFYITGILFLLSGFVLLIYHSLKISSTSEKTA
jgi:hypothetical protein